MEVNLAILLIGLGMLVLFGLFPAGLREADNAFIDTHAAQFAEVVMNGLRAKTQRLSWTDWIDPGRFQVALDPIAAGTISEQHPPTVSDPIQFPAGSETYVLYLMDVLDDWQSRTRGVSLWVWSGEFGPDDPDDFKQKAEWYYTKYYYSGVQ